MPPRGETEEIPDEVSPRVAANMADDFQPHFSNMCNKMTFSSSHCVTVFLYNFILGYFVPR